jgi:cell division protein FtsZ
MNLESAGEKPHLVRIVGVGGAGGRIVEKLAKGGTCNAGFIAIDSFFWEPGNGLGVQKIVIGDNTEPRPFCSITPEWAQRAARDDEPAIRTAVNGARLAIVLAGLGGGIGSGATPEVLRIAREEGAAAVAIVSEPFGFEGKTRGSRSQSALTRLQETADLLVRIPNGRLRGLLDPGKTMREAFEFSDVAFGLAVGEALGLLTGRGQGMPDGEAIQAGIFARLGERSRS